MRPPICAACDRDFCENAKDSGEEFDLVKFADYEALPPGMTGHPRGYEWFCQKHLDAARKLSHLPLAEAVRILRQV